MEGQGNNHDSNAPSISGPTFDLNLLPSEEGQVGETEQGSSSSGAQLNKRKAPAEGTSGVNLEVDLGSHEDAESHDEIPLIDINDFIDYSGSTDRGTRQRTSSEDENDLPENTSIPGSSVTRRNFVTPPQQSPPPASSTMSSGVTAPNLLGGPSVGLQLSNPANTGIQIPSQTRFGLGFQHGNANPPPNFHFFHRLGDPQRLETSGYHPADPNISFEATISRMASLAGYSPQSIQSLVERARLYYLIAPAWQPATFSLAAAVRRALFATPEELAFEAELLHAAELFRQAQEEEFLDEEEILDAGLSEETILAHLQQRTYAATPPQADTESCCICLDEYQEGHQLGRLDCSHEFHFECIKLWLEEKNTCPLCKRTGLAQ